MEGFIVKNFMKMLLVVVIAFAAVGVRPAEAERQQVQIADVGVAVFSQRYAAFARRPGNEFAGFSGEFKKVASDAYYDKYVNIVDSKNGVILYVNKAGYISKITAAGDNMKTTVAIMLGSLESIGMQRTQVNAANVDYLFTNLHFDNRDESRWVILRMQELNRAIYFDKPSNTDLNYIIRMSAFIDVDA